MTTPWTLAIAAKAAVLLALAALAVLAQRRAHPSSRHRTWAYALGGVLALPLLVAALPRLGFVVPATPREVASAPAAAPTPPPIVTSDVPAEPTTAVASISPRTPARSADVPAAREAGLSFDAGSQGAPALPGATEPRAATAFPWALALWLAGVALALLPYTVGTLRVRAIVRRARVLGTADVSDAHDGARRALGLRRPVRILESDDVAAPAAWGLVRPVVLLPAGFRTWPRERLELVLLHEMAHVKRFDGLLDLAGRLAAALHWFDPLAWLALAGLRRESEAACDAAVLGAGARPRDYARCLLDVARGPAPSVTFGMARPGTLETRIRAVLAEPPPRRVRVGGRVALLAGAAVVGLVAALHPTLRAAAEDPPTGAKAHEIAKPWIDGLHRLTDAAAREAAAAAVREALAKDDRVLHHAAFLAIAGTADVAWDRKALRDAVLARLATARGDAQVVGFHALRNTDPRPEDLDLLLAAFAAPSPEMHERGSHLLLLFTKGRIEGRAAEAALRLLATDDARMRREVMRGLWGATVSPEVEARLLELAKTKSPDEYHDVVYFALSTLQNKSAAVVAELARAAERSDPNVSQRAVWGLAYGVVPAAHAAAADVLVSVVELRTGLQEEALRGLTQYGGPAHAERLRALASSPALTAERREAIERTFERMRGRRPATVVPAPSPATAGPAPSPEAARTAKERVNAWKADVIQVQDPARRETALAAIDGAIRSEDAALAAAALHVLHQLRDAAYDKARFRDAVRSRMADADDHVRRAAIGSLTTVEAEPSDVERLLGILESHPEDVHSLITGAWLAKSRVEGRLAALYVRALGAADWREGRNIANQLRGMWVTPEVEDAVLASWRARPAGEVGLWWHILGQIRPTREARVRMIFEVLKEDDHSAAQLLARALEPKNLEGAAATLAADLAAERLPTAPSTSIRRLFLDVLRRSGTSAHVPVLRAYATNGMVAEELRKQAATIADELERR